MTSQHKRLMAVTAAAVVLYFFAYFQSVGISYGWEAVPVYRPWNTALVRAFFAPAQLLDSRVLRPIRWQGMNEKIRL